MIRLVIFDVDGVVVHYDRQRRMEVMAAVFGSGAEDRADAGETDADEYLRELGEHLGAAVTRDVWVTARAVAVTADPAMVDLVERLVRRLHTHVFHGYDALVARLGEAGVATE